MKSEMAFTISAAIASAIVLSTLVNSVSTYYTDKNARMESAIKAGNNPMDVYCAFEGTSESKVCLVRAAIK